MQKQSVTSTIPSYQINIVRQSGFMAHKKTLTLLPVKLILKAKRSDERETLQMD